MKLMGMEVAADVPPEPYIPPAGWAGLVTVTATVPGVAMADAGIIAMSWFPVTKVVLWAVPFQLTAHGIQWLMIGSREVEVSLRPIKRVRFTGRVRENRSHVPHSTLPWLEYLIQREELFSLSAR